jgi:hypothetical protein
MGISGSDLAPKQARFGVARFGATRFGDFYPTLILSVGGTNLARQVRLDTLEIVEKLNEEPNEAHFTLREGSLTPTEGETVIIALGTASDYTRLFTGSIVRVTQRQVTDSQEINYDIVAKDYAWLLDRRFITTRYTNESAASIAVDIIATYTTGGFTTTHVQVDLPAVDEFQLVNTRPSTALTRLANLVGAAWYIDEQRDLHLFTAETIYPNPPDLTTANPYFWGFEPTVDLSQVRTRAIVEGKRTQTLAPVDADATEIPVEDVSIFAANGGDARIEHQLIAYTGTEDGGAGSLVGPGVSPPTALSGSGLNGTGIESGVHDWGYTWVTASGETLASPVFTGQLGTLAAPSTVPARAASAGTGLNAGTYTYAVSFVIGATETTPGPTGTVVTSDGIAAPGSSPSVSTGSGLDHFGGRYAVGNSVYVRCSYVDVDGNETGGTDSNTVTVADLGGGTPEAIRISGIPVPSDPNVVSKRLYLNVNGSFVAYWGQANGTTFQIWTAAETSGSFPVGGDPSRKRVTLTSVPVGHAVVTARRVYRTVVGGSSLLLVATIADNTTTTYIDSTADGSLGAAAPTTNNTTINQIGLVGIAVGPSGTTSRKVYRSAAGQAQLKLVTTLADNTTTTYTDSTADASLGANAPTNDTSGLTQETGQVNAGATSIQVAGPAAFSSTGGWALLGNQFIRYTAVSGSSLTGVPSSGFGSLTATVSYGATITEAPRLTGVTGLADDAPSGAEVVIRVTRDDTVAQATMAAIEDGDGIHETVVDDERLSIEQAEARGDAELELFGRAIRSITYQTRHPSTRTGRTVAVQLGAIDESFLIRSVITSGFDAVASRLAHTVKKFPIQTVEAGPVRFGGFVDQLSRGEDAF